MLLPDRGSLLRIAHMQSNTGSPVNFALDNVFVVGLMGAGKTSVGKLLAKRLDKQFYDSDYEIERRTGVSISVIFEIEGEQGFRKREAAILKDLTALHNIVLATGGGVVLNGENRTALVENGTVVYLRASVNELWRRTKRDKQRPLLQTEDRLAKLSELFAQRDPLYKKVADIIADTNRQSPNKLAQKLEQELVEFVRHSPKRV